MSKELKEFTREEVEQVRNACTVTLSQSSLLTRLASTTRMVTWLVRHYLSVTLSDFTPLPSLPSTSFVLRSGSS
jgi:hypothetical protein